MFLDQETILTWNDLFIYQIGSSCAVLCSIQEYKSIDISGRF